MEHRGISGGCCSPERGESDELDAPTVETPAVYCEPSWTERAEERIRESSREYAEWHREHFGYSLAVQKHITSEDIHAEKDRMLQEMDEELYHLRHELMRVERDG